MPEVSSTEAGQIIRVSHDTIRRAVRKGLLPARQEGVRRVIRVELSGLRSFAEKYQYKFDEELAQQYIQN